MSGIALTFLLAFVVILCAVLLLTISLILTGKQNYRIGRCGLDPTKKRSKETGCGDEQKCPLCSSDTKEEDENLPKE